MADESAERASAKRACTSPAPDDLPPLPTIAPGRYRHYMGGEYAALGVVRHSESLEPMVLYRPLGADRGDWVRPYAMFVETASFDGRLQPRFQRIDGPPVAEWRWRSARLRVRSWRPDDLPALQAVYGDADAMRWVGDGQPLSAADCERWLAVSQENYRRRGYGMFAIELAAAEDSAEPGNAGPATSPTGL